MRKQLTPFLFRKIILVFSLLTITYSLSAITRPSAETRPVGFAAVSGTYLLPICGATPTYRATTSAELSADLGSNRIIIVAAGNYNSITLASYSNISIIGEDGADILTINISGGTNILIRNISVTRYTVDGFHITGGTNMWFDHCTIGTTGAISPDHDNPDGAMDITGSSPDYITISWCKFQNTWKTSLHGSSDTDASTTTRHITWYANYLFNTNQRTPRIRGGNTHVLCNMYENTGWGRANGTPENTYGEINQVIDAASEYRDLPRINAIGYGVMAAMSANAVVENNFFLDVLFPIVPSRPCTEFEAKYGDLQSADINNGCRDSPIDAGNGGCIALLQTGNAYDDSGLPTQILVKKTNDLPDATITSTNYLTYSEYRPLGYSYVYNTETRWIIKPDRLNPGGRSIMFDDYNPGGAFNPGSFANYYPSGFVKMTAAEVREIVSQYAGATAYETCPVGAAPTLTTPANKDQTVAAAITNIVFTWGGGAVDVKFFDLPAGLTVTKNTTTKTLTLSGTPTASGTYTIMTEGGTGSAVSIAGTITLSVTTPTLTDPVNKTQSVLSGTAIGNIVFTWGGTATDVTITGLPAGLSFVKDAVAKTLTISGSPTATATYTVTTVGGTGAATINGIITALPNPPTLTDPANKTQSVTSATAIASIIFTWGGGATDVNVTGLPAGVTTAKNALAKTLTLSGSPTATASYTVTTIGGTGAAVSISGTITATPTIACLALIKAQILALATTGTYRLAVFDASGTTEIKTLANGVFAAGNTDFSFFPSGLASGTYVYKLFSGATMVKTGAFVVP